MKNALTIEYTNVIYISMTALFLSLIMVPALRRWAIEKRHFDIPNDRKVHIRPMPRLGGVAIFIAFLFSILIFEKINCQVRGILAGSLILFSTGLVDDLYGLSAKKKFFGEICGCLITIFVGQLYITNIGDPLGTGPISLPLWIGIPFTVFAIVGVVNALNLLDGLDGLAGGFAVMALSGFFLIGYFEGNEVVMSLCAALIGGIFGFLRFNIYPSRIFMGDAGSLTIGFILGFLAIFLTQGPESTIKPVVPFLILGLPIIDTLRVMIRRLFLGKSPFLPDRSHVHHRFLDLGFHHRFTVMIIHGLTLFWIMVALVFYQQPERLLFSTYLILSIVFYTSLSLSIKYKGKLPILSLDSDRSLRETRFYRWLASLSTKIDPVLASLLLVFLFRTNYYTVAVDAQVAVISGILLTVSSLSFFYARDLRNPFLMAVLFISGLIIAFQSERLMVPAGFCFVSYTMINRLIICSVAVLVFFKMAFKKREYIMRYSTMDFLLFGLPLCISISSTNLKLPNIYPEVIMKGLILFLSFKVLVIHSRTMLRWALWGVHGMLLALVLHGI